MSPQMKTSDYVAEFLVRNEVPYVFELAGGMITHLLDSFMRNGRPRIVSMHHEQAVAFAAEAVGRLTRVPGVGLATSGPGATNLLTGIGSCYFDSSPAVFLTGQVNRNEQRGSRLVRQLGFQETDIVSIARPITKAAWQATAPEEVPQLLRNAFSLAMSGRHGPVLVDLPMDVQRLELSPPPNSFAPESAPVIAADGELVREVVASLRRAQRPLILVGGGLRAAQAVGLFREFVLRTRVPAVYSLLAVDSLPYQDPMRVGMIGTYGNRWANLAVARADFLLVLGSRLDIRQTGSDTKAFKGERSIYHVDIDAGEINNRVTGCRAVVGDAASFLSQALATCHDRIGSEEWLAEILALRKTWPDIAELADVPGINPNAFMHRLSAATGGAAGYVVDVGQHQMWAAQSLEPGNDQVFLTSGGMGSMGFALPAAIGACFACPGRGFVIIAGDGGFQCNIQELQTVVHHRLPLSIVVVNNGSYGMVRQFQQSYFGGRYQSTVLGYSAPDFVKVADAYGIPGRAIRKPSEVESALAWLAEHTETPCLLEVFISQTANAYPKIAFGRPLTDMEPEFIPDKESELLQ